MMKRVLMDSMFFVPIYKYISALTYIYPNIYKILLLLPL